MIRCAFCGETIPTAALCRHCGHPQLVDCQQLIALGPRCHLGHTGEQWAVWTVAGGRPLGGFDDEGAARAYFARFNAPAQHVSNAPLWIALAVVFVIVAALYVGVHSHRYSHCLVQPGLFSWPSSCL